MNWFFSAKKYLPDRKIGYMWMKITTIDTLDREMGKKTINGNIRYNSIDKLGSSGLASAIRDMGIETLLFAQRDYILL